MLKFNMQLDPSIFSCHISTKYTIHRSKSGLQVSILQIQLSTELPTIQNPFVLHLNNDSDLRLKFQILKPKSSCSPQIHVHLPYY